MNKWYVIKTKPKREKDVQSLLCSANYELFLPTLRTLTGTKPLFPSYLFIQASLNDPLHHRLVRFTRGVTKILGDTEGPCPILGAIVEVLKRSTQNGSLIEQELLFQVGDEVIVKRGILKDLKGIVRKNMSDLGRIKVLFKWLNRSLWAELRYQDLEPAA